MSLGIRPITLDVRANFARVVLLSRCLRKSQNAWWV